MLDGMEHLRSGAAVLSDLLRGAPRLRILTTSRTRLGLAEEWTVEVRGLAPPGAAGGPGRGARRRPVPGPRPPGPAGRPLDPANRPHVYRLCHLLGGLPQALILAAEWLRLLPPAELVADVERGLDLGPAGAGRQPPGALAQPAQPPWRTPGAG